MTSQPDLPPMPEPKFFVNQEAKRHGMCPCYRHLQTLNKYGGAGVFEFGFTAAQMHEYARLAIRSNERKDFAQSSACGHPASLMLKSAETGADLYCELCDDKSGRRDAETMDAELNERLRTIRTAVALAYGHLWHVNNEPGTPAAMYSPEQAAYAARKLLRELLSSEERGQAINAVRAGIYAAPPHKGSGAAIDGAKTQE